MAELPDGSIDLVACDLPYGITAASWDRCLDLGRMWAELARLPSPGSCCVLTACQPFTTKLVASNLKWFRHEWVWDKARSTGFLNANRAPLRRHETALVFAPRQPRYFPQMGEGKPYTITNRNREIEVLGRKKATQVEWTTVNHGTRYPTTILSIPNRKEDRGRHGTQKPVALMKYFVETYSSPGQTVLDMTMGSGSTGRAALEAGRNFVGIELRPEAFASAAAWIAEAAPRGLAGA